MDSPSWEDLRLELDRLDLLLHREILRLRAGYRLSLDEFRGLYVSDAQVDALVAKAAEESGSPDAAELTRVAQGLSEENRTRIPPDSRWARLIAEFGLDPLERDVLLVAVAPELDLKYETLYAYLHNDVTRKAPSCDLAARVLASSREESIEVRRRLHPGATLFTEGLLVPVGDSRRLLHSEFHAAHEVVRRLLAIDLEPPPLPGPEDVFVPSQAAELLNRMTRDSPPAVMETDDTSAARAAAAAACRRLGLPLAPHDLSAMPLGGLAGRLRLAQRLERRGLWLDCSQAFWQNDTALPEARQFVSRLSGIPGPLFLRFAARDPWRDLLRGERILPVPFPEPDFDARRSLWLRSLGERGENASAELAEEMAARFTLASTRIAAAVGAAADLRDAAQPGAALDADALSASVRSQSDQALARFARKVPLVYEWDDLVLPAGTLAQLREVASAARHRHLVFDTWGLARRQSAGRGVKALFSGSSGTGKTMSAGVLARDLGLDLYQIELAGVVSKYIGETEKNLDRIFQAAHSSNGVLFFDEADALFGKRTEVKDAHDRYANIEVAYLLQKMEDYEGIAILASNLSKNIDEAFARRMHYAVEFPVPDEALRLRLWRGMIPSHVPLAPDVDLEFLAGQFRIAGGDIRNVILTAAFVAAGAGRPLSMAMLSKAMARQLIKQGKAPSAADFKQYFPLVSAGGRP